MALQKADWASSVPNSKVRQTKPHKLPVGEQRFENEELARPIIADKLRQSLAGVAKVTFTTNDYLDRKLAIDGFVYFLNGMRSSFQSKALSFSYAHRRTVTIEYYNDPVAEAHGDWFHCVAELYFCGYWTEDGTDIRPWRLLDWCLAQQMTIEKRIVWQINSNSKTNARANFRYVSMDELPMECILGGQG